jgi:phage baseplate assembly protein W
MPSDNAFELRGLLHPFQRDRRSDFVSGSGEALIRSAVAQVLGTMAATEFTPGEIPWRTEFGSGLHLLRNKRNDALLQELARIHVVDALKRWEPRIRVTSIQITREYDRGENVLAIRLRYDVICVCASFAERSTLLDGIEQVVAQAIVS